MILEFGRSFKSLAARRGKFGVFDAKIRGFSAQTPHAA
jgi:hypothetical protein